MLSVKKCSDCRIWKFKNQFYKNGASIDALESRCKDCNHLQLKDRKQSVKEFIRAQKARPCADCGESYPYYVMDFDHRVGTHKKFELSKPKSVSLEKIAEEISKCDVVCANCHRMRTHARKKKC